MVTGAVRRFINHEAASGVLLLGAAVAALVLSNSTFAETYAAALATKAGFAFGPLDLSKLTVQLWINDGLMALFFLLVGLEIKREVMRGELSTFKEAALPAFAAVGGIALPAATYLLVTAGAPELAKGWAIPAATDIAFALGVLALLGPRVPLGLKVFLLALAIIDDLGAILIIALFYTASLDGAMLLGAAAVGAALTVLNLAGVRRIWPYLLLGIVLWVFVLKSGVHPTLAGVALAFAIPIVGPADKSPLETLEHAIHPFVAYGVTPVFALANAGVSLEGLDVGALVAPLPLGVASGLVFGKIVGVTGMVWLAVSLGLARLPDGVGWGSIVGAAALAGVGFTMSLFIGNLAFPGEAAAADVRIGVLAGSVAAAIIGYLILTRSLPSAAEAKRADAKTPA